MMTHPLVTDFGAPACVRSNNDLTECNGDHLKTGFISNSACESYGRAHSGQEKKKNQFSDLIDFSR